MKPEPDKNERRQADRFPMEREVRYRVKSRKAVDGFGVGKTIDMSSNGVLFAADQSLMRGSQLELSISWPAQLNSTVALKLVAHGRVVRCEQAKAAIELQRYEFRTQASKGPAVG